MTALKEVSIRAVITGLIVDIGGTFLFFFVFSIIGGILLTSSGRDVDELKDFAETSPFIVVSSFAGLLFSALGGYVSARIAGRAEVRNALATGVLSFLVGLVLIFGSPISQRSWPELLSLILIIPCALLGGYACLRSKQGSASSERL
jgi:MFS family permease